MDDKNPNNNNNALTDFAQYDQHKNAKKVVIEDIATGNGNEVKAGNNITVHYRGWLTNGQIFDESYGRGEPFSFTPGRGQVITGWEEGVIGMQAGGKRRLIVPPVAGYGNQSVGSIPAGSVLVFDIELLRLG